MNPERFPTHGDSPHDMHIVIRGKDRTLRADYSGGPYIDLTFGTDQFDPSEVINVWNYETGKSEVGSGDLAVRIAVRRWMAIQDQEWPEWYEGYIENHRVRTIPREGGLSREGGSREGVPDDAKGTWWDDDIHGPPLSERIGNDGKPLVPDDGGGMRIEVAHDPVDCHCAECLRGPVPIVLKSWPALTVPIDEKLTQDQIDDSTAVDLISRRDAMKARARRLEEGAAEFRVRASALTEVIDEKVEESRERDARGEPDWDVDDRVPSDGDR